ncbi:23S rRNA (uracil(1939)-C(5))-methyltransferase RlmD [Desulfofalx alkaliphila]|uniref:23S rRNA (uracil(1939)-C(5))-methyltransferase RlmD n=1 Tax=Desulfofalx alkaliphila TaxID=105483 RepID=UPI0004E0CFC3|nr:23S rRNA (uracil(1939)-C(5))-methyltransferase RlmD [Desulfofalx alkaliphila]
MNKEVYIEITGLTHQGEGIGRLPNGQAVFVPGTVPGEKVLVKVNRSKKKFARASLVQVVESAAQRCRPKCSGVHHGCGGCVLQHIDYQAQLHHKTQLVTDSLTRIGKLEGVKVHPTIGMKHPWHYRNKVHFQVQQVDDKLAIGYYEQGSHNFLPLSSNNCLLLDENLNDIAGTLEQLLNKYNLSAYHWWKKQGLVRHLVLRRAIYTGEIMVVVVTTGDRWDSQGQFAEELRSKHTNVVSVVRTINNSSNRLAMGEENIVMAGKKTITERLGPLEFDISANSFFQVNPQQTMVLYQEVLKYAALTGQEKLLDAYCGIGTIALYLAGSAKEVTGIEVVPQAVANARQNARRNGINNVEFFQGEVERLLPLMSSEGYRPEVVVLDPPRKGCDKQALEAVIQMAPAKIIYVSCDPGTLARDLAYLVEEGSYRVIEVQPVDMFPQTRHVETICLMSRK